MTVKCSAKIDYLTIKTPRLAYFFKRTTTGSIKTVKDLELHADNIDVLLVEFALLTGELPTLIFYNPEWFTK